MPSSFPTFPFSAPAAISDHYLQWIDTCCIDKSSSAELSEAINSMFRWYRDSEVCYAFLSDVDADEPPSADKSTFQQSRWFTRGWTLQELIAPGVVYFYGAGWKQIGSRETLLELIVKITRISPEYFSNGDLSQFSAAQKMSWAATRKTTRIEDIAYCLLGLFDINMPLLYGEGEHAVVRLQEEILRQFEDDSLFSHGHANILAPSPWWFRGSKDILRRRAWPYKDNPSLVLGRNISISRSRITMTFPQIQISRAETPEEFHALIGPLGAALWPQYGISTTCHVALLDCGTSEGSTSALLLIEESPRVFTKLSLPFPAEFPPELQRNLAQRVIVQTMVIARFMTAIARKPWEWREGDETLLRRDLADGSAVKMGLFSVQGNSASRARIMRPITRPARQSMPTVKLAEWQDRYRDKLVIKGPCRATSGFQLQYVYVGQFRMGWLERGDEVHLLPHKAGDQGRPCLVFSSRGRESFMITFSPTRASANADLFTNIPPWEGKDILMYMEMVEKQRRADKFEAPCSRATQQADSGRKVMVELGSRRRSNGWWVYISVTEVCSVENSFF
jgi:hypothetical protein